MKRLINYILGELLFLANSNPPYMWRDGFYRIKDHVLATYADLEGHHLQHIFKECHGCDKGKIKKRVRMLGEWIEMSAGRCPKCCGSGRYEEFWTVLESYRLGRRRFHRPLKKYYSKDSLPALEFSETIEGLIRHDRPKYYLYTEAAFWLAFLFDRKTFLRWFGGSGQCSRKFTPMVILSTWIYDTQVVRNRIGFRIYQWKQKLVRLRQAFCRHEFPHTNIMPAFDECKHCGIKRIHLTGYRNAVTRP